MIHKDSKESDILKLTPACSCNKCSHGCTMGSGVLAKGDKEQIAKYLKITEKELEEKYLENVNLFSKKHYRPKLEKKPYGKCIFYNNGCSIHPVKPLQCKVAMGCKEYGEDLMVWFMLNHIIDFDDANSVRDYMQYLKSGGKTIKGSKIEEILPENTIKKIKNYEILN